MNILFKFKVAEAHRKNIFLQNGTIVPEFILQTINIEKLSLKHRSLIFDINSFDEFSGTELAPLKLFKSETVNGKERFSHSGEWLLLFSETLTEEILKNTLDAILKSRKPKLKQDGVVNFFKNLIR